MSKYTTEVRFICEEAAGLEHSVGYEDVEEVLDNSYAKIFDFDYPIFDEAYRPILEKKILRHYYTREIGLETVGLWKLKLNTKMNEIMPYYNQRYSSELIQFNPLYDTDLTTTHQRVNTDKSDGESDTHNTHSNSYANQNLSNVWHLFQDTPQSGLLDVENMNYLSAANKDQEQSNNGGNNSGLNDSNNSFENNFKGIEDYEQHIMGSSPSSSFSKRLKEFRETFLNIDMEIIQDLSSLFMYLW